MLEDLGGHESLILDAIENDFNRAAKNNTKINRINKLIAEGKATYKDVNDLAIEIGEELAKVFGDNLSSAVLPDGKMYYNMADRLLNKTLGKNYDLVSSAAVDVQTILNKLAKLGIKGMKAPINQDRINGLVKKIARADNFDDVAWLLNEPVINFTQSIVEDCIHVNADFHHQAGLMPKIIRKIAGDCCDWCKAVEGEYSYPDVPKDVYRRHRYCRCTVDYDPGDGKRQNVHTKKWKNIDRRDEITARRVVGLTVGGTTVTGMSVHAKARLQERNVSLEAVRESIRKPLKISGIQYDDKGRPSIKLIGNRTTVYINPDTGVITTAHPTHTKTANKLIEERRKNEIQHITR